MSTLSIGGGQWLAEAPARLYLAMRADGCPAGITSSTRSYELQTLYYRNQGKPGWPGKADHPDRSKHVWRPWASTEAQRGARALDLPEPARSWVRRNGHRYGWYCDRVSREPWHQECEPWQVASLVNVLVGQTGTVPGAPTGTLPDPLEADMPLSDDDIERIALRVGQIRASTAESSFVEEISHIKTKVARMEAAERRPEVVYFKVAGDPLDRWCEADLESRTWAIAPTPDVAARRRDVLGVAGRDVFEWGLLTGSGQHYVQEPSAFGQQVPWDRFDPATL